MAVGTKTLRRTPRSFRPSVIVTRIASTSSSFTTLWQIRKVQTRLYYLDFCFLYVILCKGWRSIIPGKTILLLLLLDFLKSFNDIPELIGEKFREWCKAFFDGKIHFAFLDVKWVPTKNITIHITICLCNKYQPIW